ncbi:MAG: FAD-dependent thymidylate synthase [Bacteroidota bacterium]|nr:FAD-dependent thymidylate synthase [Bacteroidota bacterium]
MNVQTENIIGKEFNCLDRGFVRLIDVMGDDSSIVQAARVSYGKGTKSVSEDRGLIRYLMRNRHTSPFEMVEFKFHVKLPIFVARQWIRHRTANVNEYSGRYSEMKDEFYLPEPEFVRTQSAVNKQGRSDETLSSDSANKIIEVLSDSQRKLFSEYQDMLAEGLAREVARINLPLATYTEWYWKIDLHNLFNFLRLRLDAHAQYEIRVYAQIISDLVKLSVPLAYEAFEDYTLEAISFSKKEIAALRFLINNGQITDENLSGIGIKGREASDFRDKLNAVLVQ